MSEARGVLRRPSSSCAACATAATGGECPDCGLFWLRGEDGKMIGIRPQLTVFPDFQPHLLYVCNWCKHEWVKPLGEQSDRDPFECRNCGRSDNVGLAWHHSLAACRCKEPSSGS